MTHAQIAGGISIAHCLATIATQAVRNESLCPAFLVESLQRAQTTCADVDGRLVPTPTADVWTLDVNGDNTPEFAFEYDGVVSCEGAWSVFSCGSLGCPKTVYQKHDGAWRPIAEIGASAPETLEVLDATPGQSYHDLRAGCTGSYPCNEYWYYQWTGEQYQRTYLDVRGHRVDFAASVHGLYGVVGELDILATPVAGAAIIGHYGSDTEVAIVGTAVDADYYYVSPCNACESGFAPKSAVRPLQQ
jgi:hypothetical protein